MFLRPWENTSKHWLVRVAVNSVELCFEVANISLLSLEIQSLWVQALCSVHWENDDSVALLESLLPWSVGSLSSLLL